MAKKIQFGRFGQQKKPNYKKALVLLLILIAFILIYMNSENWITRLFGK